MMKSAAHVHGCAQVEYLTVLHPVEGGSTTSTIPRGFTALQYFTQQMITVVLRDLQGSSASKMNSSACVSAPTQWPTHVNQTNFWAL